MAQAHINARTHAATPAGRSLEEFGLHSDILRQFPSKHPLHELDIWFTCAAGLWLSRSSAQHTVFCTVHLCNERLEPRLHQWMLDGSKRNYVCNRYWIKSQLNYISRTNVLLGCYISGNVNKSAMYHFCNTLQ